jgi:hypothetical protein
MKTSLLAISAAAASLLIATSAMAAPFTRAPVVDFRAQVTLSLVPNFYNTLSLLPYIGVPNSSPPPNWLMQVNPVTPCAPNTGPPCILFSFYDNITFHGPGPAFPERIIGVAFHSGDDASPTSDLRITTIYGLDLNFGGTALSVGGVDARAPQFVAAGESFLGRDGRSYLASSSRVVPISGLASDLGPAFDLSIFGGDSAGLVYVFDTYIPNGDIQNVATSVPEPASWALMIAGFGMVGGAARRRRSVAVTA